MTKAGQIYLAIAEEVLNRRYPSLDEGTRADLLARAQYEELEEIIGIKDEIVKTVECLNLALAWRRKPIPPDKFIRYILIGDTAGAPSTKFKNKLGLISPEQQGEIGMDVVRSRRKIFVQDNDWKFGDENYRDEWYRYMPVEMVGWEDIESDDVIFIRPIMIAIGMNGVQRRRFHDRREVTPEGDYFRETYRRAQRELKSIGCITASPQSFSRFFRDLDRHGYSYSDKIGKTLRNNEEVLVRTAAQVLQHNPRGTFCQNPYRDDD